MKKKIRSLFSLLLSCCLFCCQTKPSSDSPDDSSKDNKILTDYSNIREEKEISDPSKEVSIRIVRGKNVLSSEENELTFSSFQPNDIIEITSDYQYIYIEAFGQKVLLFSREGRFLFQIPSSGLESIYPSKFYSGSQTIKASVATKEEIQEERNLALNPFDMMYKDEEAEENNKDSVLTSVPDTSSKAVEEGEVSTYPHAYANRVTRNEASFFARNTIDGNKKNTSHGSYPNESWGYDQKEDAVFTLYFGREVELSSLSFMLRNDTTGSPRHDTYWSKATIEFSDGSTEELSFDGPSTEQEFHLSSVKKTTYIRIRDIQVNTNIQSQNYAALTEFTAYGRDTMDENPVAVRTYITPTFGGKERKFTTDIYSIKEIEDNLNRCNDWFVNVTDQRKLVVPTYNDQRETVRIDSDDWKDSVYYSGLTDSMMTLGDEEKYLYLRGVGNQFSYIINDGYYTPHGDHYQIGETYLQLSQLRKGDYKEESAKKNATHNLTRTADERNTNDQAGDRSRDWSHMGFWWCDALYMALNTYTLLSFQTKEDTYVQKAFDGYEYAKTNLYNTTYDLWARDATQLNLTTNTVDPRTGKKYPVFWSRGNAWVFSALAKQLLYLDETKYPDIYDTYKEDYLKLASSIKEYQREDGTWNASIVDENYYGGRETTGTCGYIYAYCIGLSLGILDNTTYMPIVEKAYDGLMENCILPNTDQLGYMQTVGYQPQNYRSEDYSKNITNEFGMGLFLLASSALIRLCSDYKPVSFSAPCDPQAQLL